MDVDRITHIQAAVNMLRFFVALLVCIEVTNVVPLNTQWVPVLRSGCQLVTSLALMWLDAVLEELKLNCMKAQRDAAVMHMAMMMPRPNRFPMPQSSHIAISPLSTQPSFEMRIPSN
jgi:hypothetical protein